MRYKDLKEQRDAAITRAREAERMSMKSEFDRVTAEFEAEKARLLEEGARNAQESYQRGFNHGVHRLAECLSCDLTKRVVEMQGEEA